MYKLQVRLGRGLQLDNDELREKSCVLGLVYVAVMQATSNPHCSCIALLFRGHYKSSLPHCSDSRRACGCGYLQPGSEKGFCQCASHHSETDARFSK